jgi:cytochrome c553
MALGILLLVKGIAGLMLVAVAGSWYVSGALNGAYEQRSDTQQESLFNDNIFNYSPMTGMSEEFMGNMMTDFSKETYSSPGERLFLTGEDASGVRIVPTFDSQRLPSMGSTQMKLSCVHCHNKDGSGGVDMPNGMVESADISWETLKKIGYDETKLARTIREGVDENGGNLSVWMPMWTVTDTQMKDLIAYIKTLEADTAAAAY